MENRAKRQLWSIAVLLIVASFVGTGALSAQPAASAVDQARELMNQTKFQEALATLEPLQPVSQDDIEVQYLTGLARVMLQDYQGALVPLRRAKAIDPTDPQIRYLLGRAYAELGDLGNALTELEAVFGKAPETPDLGYHLGKVHYQETRYPPARDVLSVAVSSHDLMRQKVHFLLGLAYERLGDSAKATENLRTAVNIAPDTELGRGIAQRLAAEDGTQVTQERGSSGEVAPTAPIFRRQRKLAVDAYASLLYDDNARLDPDAHPTDPTVAILRAAPGGRNDAGFNLAVRPEYTFHEDGDSRASVSYFGSHTSYFDLDAVDFTNHEVAVNWFSRRSDDRNAPLFAASLSYDHSELGDNDFLERFTFAPSITIRSDTDPNDGTVIYGILSHRDFEQNLPIVGEDRSGDLFSLGATHYWYFDNGRHNVRIGLLGDRDRTNGGNYRYDGWRPSIGATFTFWTDGAFSLDAFHHVREYDSVNTIFGIARYDHDNRLVARLSKPVNEDLTAFVEGSHNDARSNIPVFDFERDIVNAGVHYRY